MQQDRQKTYVVSPKSELSDIENFENLGILKGCGFAAWIYVPIYYNLGITSINEYLDLRFGKLTRTVMAVIGLIQGRVLRSFKNCTNVRLPLTI